MAILYPRPIIYGKSSSSAYGVRTLFSEFGDGYQEVTPDGINHIVQAGVLVHPLLEKGDTAHSVGADTLRAYLKANCGTSNIVEVQNVMEDPSGLTPLNVYLESWSEAYDGVLFTFKVKYREAFNE